MPNGTAHTKALVTVLQQQYLNLGLNDRNLHIVLFWKCWEITTISVAKRSSFHGSHDVSYFVITCSSLHAPESFARAEFLLFYSSVAGNSVVDPDRSGVVLFLGTAAFDSSLQRISNAAVLAEEVCIVEATKPPRAVKWYVK